MVFVQAVWGKFQNENKNFGTAWFLYGEDFKMIIQTLALHVWFWYRLSEEHFKMIIKTWHCMVFVQTEVSKQKYALYTVCSSCPGNISN